ncbi:MAG TPA: tetratricopeptide repeat protein [Gemmataceae bacterium]|nr:tetratricopeptide repeat protein [Gemmataceae bacterium]
MNVRGRRTRIVLILFLLLPIGFGIVQVGRYLQALHDFHQAQHALEQRDFAQAQARLARCLEFWPSDTETCFLAAQTARRRGAGEEAAHLLRRYRELGGVPEALDVELRLLRLQSGDLRESSRYLSYCTDHPDSPQSGFLLEALIQGGIRVGDLPLANTATELWLKHFQNTPDQIQGWVWRGDCARRRGDMEETQSAYRRALELDENQEQARLGLAESLIRQAPQEALRHLERLHQRQPNDRAIRLHLARCRRCLGELDEAIRLLDGLLQEMPDDVPALLERGRVALDLGQEEQAERLFRQAQTLAPDQRDPTLMLARCLRLRNKNTEAKQLEVRLEEINARLKRNTERLLREGRLPSPQKIESGLPIE